MSTLEEGLDVLAIKRLDLDGLDSIKRRDS